MENTENIIKIEHVEILSDMIKRYKSQCLFLTDWTLIMRHSNFILRFSRTCAWQIMHVGIQSIYCKNMLLITQILYLKKDLCLTLILNARDQTGHRFYYFAINPRDKGYGTFSSLPNTYRSFIQILYDVLKLMC